MLEIKLPAYSGVHRHLTSSTFLMFQAACTSANNCKTCDSNTPDVCTDCNDEYSLSDANVCGESTVKTELYIL